MYAVLLLIEKAWLLPYLKKHKIVGHLYVLFFVLIGFVLFDASSVADFWDCIVSMFGGGQIKPGYDREPVLSEKLCSDHPDCGDRGDAASCEIIWKIAEKERLKADA